jgi:sigma-B regulation protein RsbU (phosphoserine phosphatase)
VTLFYLIIDPLEKIFRWVRAGHVPGIYYHAAQDRFEELMGPGIALGVNESITYEENHKKAMSKGDIILLSTDGIWEVRNPNGSVFDRQDIFEIIRRNASTRAKAIIDAIFEFVMEFQEKEGPEDDLTLVVIKAMGDS